MTPAEEITAAVEKLRTGRFAGGITMTPAVAGLVAAREPLATLLERQGRIAAEMQAFLGDEFQDGALDQNVHDALAVARQINGSPS